MKEKSRYYLISSKPDDYGAKISILVYTTKAKLKKVYLVQDVQEEHVETLKQYIEWEYHSEYVEVAIKSCER